jgi:pSer/pThr/pTyr-binding forkhead associated (FHA) protein
MASLCLLNEDGVTAERWELRDQQLAVGRGEAADIVVNDATLSRRHFMIVPEAGYFVLKDLHSQNGTFVDGRPAQATRLQDHDCIAAGRTLFIFSDRARP